MPQSFLTIATTPHARRVGSTALVLFTMCLGVFIAQLDSSVVAARLPS